MSDPTYRIDVSHDPHSATLPWDARIVRLSDDVQVAMVSGESHIEAQSNAQTWIADEMRRERGYSLFVDDDGQRVEAHSVKAS